MPNIYLDLYHCDVEKNKVTGRSVYLKKKDFSLDDVICAKIVTSLLTRRTSLRIDTKTGNYSIPIVDKNVIKIITCLKTTSKINPKISKFHRYFFALGWVCNGYKRTEAVLQAIEDDTQL